MGSLRRLLLAAAVAGSACASSTSEASVYSFGTPSKPTAGDKAPVLSPDNARLYIAHQLDVAQYHSLKNADEATLELLNQDLVSQAPLFAASDDDSTARTLIIVEGVENPAELVGNVEPSFTISSPPQQEANKAFIGDLLAQYRKRFGPQNKYFEDPDAQMDSISSPDAPAAIHLSSINSVKDLAARLSLLQESKSTVTLILMPSQQSKKTTSTWGTYDKPPSKHVARHAQKELPLSSTPIVALDETSPSPNPSTSPNPKNATVPRVTIPRCYSSESNCINATASCAGHGVCAKKFTEHADDNEEGAECWACACSPTVVTDAKGRVKTTYWGGPACQKKDISTQFFLLAGFTIAGVAAVTWGIGMLYSIGEQDLPSVLSAGISGPTARK